MKTTVDECYNGILLNAENLDTGPSRTGLSMFPYVHLHRKGKIKYRPNPKIPMPDPLSSCRHCDP